MLWCPSGFVVYMKWIISYSVGDFKLRSPGAVQEIASKGFTVHSMGSRASVRDMEQAALRLMRVDPTKTGHPCGSRL